MDGKLREHIEEYGGKHGALVYLREQVDGGGKYVLPLEVLKDGDAYTGENHRAVKAACKEVGSDRVIIRTSEPTDFQGMVDAMPTRVVDAGGWFSRGRIAKVIEQVRQRCAHPDVLRYAEVEGFGYDPKRVSVSVTPFSGYPHGLVTEHPNQDGVRLVDQFTPYGDSDTAFDHNAADFLDDELVYKYRCDRGFKRFLPVQKWLRESGVLDSNIAYQFECGSGGRNPILFQVREFARRASANFEVDGRSNIRIRRVFGVTPEDGVLVDVSHGRKVPNDAGDDQLFALVVGYNSSLLEMHQVADPRIAGYFGGGRSNSALSHQTTRFVQAALRHEHGFADVSLASRGFDVAKGSRKVRVVSDGFTQKIERVE
ncbi:hypothetical protein A2344_02430 [Candidatus Peregrinibacteria bacterium RIFOXYB12_FULL_41_12]|nr:MAG: hypothetical protein A2244_00680 [Candidatus Peregrinibacteria bacterium RIFOXYA2_FULL_41_18]OGJ49634.1 MAG: hypothetical protein A2344_02430 [Candidatus Peregrinibacteria bacterium RIFOXYB12_FULL_41_12]